MAGESVHRARIRWDADREDLRAHTVELSGETLAASSALDGNPERADPEEMFVASLSSCHMLWFLSLARAERIRVTSYEDEPEGRMDGKRFVSVALRPRIACEGEIGAEQIESLHRRAHERCFIANSVTCAVEIEVGAEPPRVRRARESDAAAVADVHVRSWQAAYRGVLPDELLDGLSTSEREESWRQLLSADRDRWLILVVEDGCGDLVGFCSVATPSLEASGEGDVAEIGALYVDPDHWRRGVGGALMTAALDQLHERGWREVALWVLPENRGALAFYAEFGFEVEEGAEKREERSGRPVIRLRAQLRPAARHSGASTE